MNHPIEHAVLYRLADVDGSDVLGGLEVGDRAGDLEDARVGAGAEAKPPESRLEQYLDVAVTRAVLLDQFLRELGVAEELVRTQTRQLPLPGLDPPTPPSAGWNRCPLRAPLS